MHEDVREPFGSHSNRISEGLGGSERLSSTILFSCPKHCFPRNADVRLTAREARKSISLRSNLANPDPFPSV